MTLIRITRNVQRSLLKYWWTSADVGLLLTNAGVFIFKSCTALPNRVKRAICFFYRWGCAQGNFSLQSRPAQGDGTRFCPAKKCPLRSFEHKFSPQSQAHQRQTWGIKFSPSIMIPIPGILVPHFRKQISRTAKRYCVHCSLCLFIFHGQPEA